MGQYEVARELTWTCSWIWLCSLLGCFRWCWLYNAAQFICEAFPCICTRAQLQSLTSETYWYSVCSTLAMKPRAVVCSSFTRKWQHKYHSGTQHMDLCLLMSSIHLLQSCQHLHATKLRHHTHTLHKITAISAAARHHTTHAATTMVNQALWVMAWWFKALGLGLCLGLSFRIRL